MVNYSNGKIYKIEPICEHDEGDVYFGSTTKNLLSQRMDEHRGKFKHKTGMCSSKILFDKYGLENCVIILLESVDAKSKDELVAVEAKYIIGNKCVNKYVPLRTQKEYKIDNAEKIKEYKKIYQTDNSEKIKERKRIYYEVNKATINEQCKINYDANKDKVKERKKIYRDANKDTINEYQKQYRLKQKEQSIN
jgi:hypothetical protein